MKSLSLFIITLVFTCFCAYGQAANTDTLCRLDSLPSIHFKPKSARLNKAAIKRLDDVIQLLRENAYCQIQARSLPASSDSIDQIITWNRVNAVIKYMVDKGSMAEDRITFIWGGYSGFDAVDLVPVSKINRVPSPHVNGEKKLLQNSTSASNLHDSDGDGITDQFDLEPDTPANAEVDTHGRAIDTDLDGVPDYFDKERLTQAKCFPVNKDGVGVCPEPRYSTPDFVIVDVFCKLPKIPPIIFSNNSPKLTKDIIRFLDSTANLLRNHPGCSVEIIPYFPVLENNNHSQLQLCWDEVYNIITYLEKAGIDESRLMFSASRPGNTNSVSIEATDERGLYLLPPPYPNLSQIKGLPVKQIKAEYEVLKKSQQ